VPQILLKTRNCLNLALREQVHASVDHRHEGSQRRGVLQVCDAEASPIEKLAGGAVAARGLQTKT